MHKHPSVERVVVISGTIVVQYEGSDKKTLGPGSYSEILQIPIVRCSAVASLLAYFFSRRQARSRFYRALLAGISNALHGRIAALLRERYWPLKRC